VLKGSCGIRTLTSMRMICLLGDGQGKRRDKAATVMHGRTP